MDTEVVFCVLTAVKSVALSTGARVTAHLVWVLLDLGLGVGLLPPEWLWVCRLEGSPRLSSTAARRFPGPPEVHEGSGSSYPHQHLVFSCFLKCSHRSGQEWHVTVVWFAFS